MRARAVAGLLLAIVALAITSLAVFPAPTTKLWLLAIAVTEWGHYLAILLLLPLAVPALWKSVPGRIACAVLIISAAVALSPMVRAIRYAESVPRSLDASFGLNTTGMPRPEPLSVARLFSRGEPSGTIRTVRYTGGSVPLALDLYLPARGNSPAPLVVVIHGGSWQSGTRTDLPELNRYLARRGFAVASVSYRFAPRYPFPASVEDVRTAIRTVGALTDSLDIDDSRIALIGRSAGGQIALTAAYSPPRDPRIKGVISYYAPPDLIWGYNHPSNPNVIDSKGVIAAYMRGAPPSSPRDPLYLAASPINFAADNVPPTLLIHGGRDELVTSVQSRRLDAELARYGRRHLLIELPWATHGCDYVFTGPCGQISSYAAAEFLDRVLR